MPKGLHSRERFTMVKMVKMDKIELSRVHHVIGHFRKKTIIFRDIRDHQEHDAKNRLSIPGPSPEKLMAEVYSLKKN